jgi:hypothetical protein
MSMAWWTPRRVSGVLLLAGFLLASAGAFAFSTGVGDKSVILSAAMPATAFGLALLEAQLRDSGEGILSRLGLAAFLLAAGLWLVAEAIFLDRGSWIEPLERQYVFLSSLALACYGGALLGARLVPAWIGRFMCGWGALAFVLELLAFVPPLMPNFGTLPLAVALLLRSGSPTVRIGATRIR